MILLGLYFLLITSLAVYSYALVDPNITFFNHPLWANFRNIVVEFGYNRRHDSWLVYLSIIVLLFLFNYVFVIKYKKLVFSPFKIALIVGLILVFSYPFLSHDFFSYIFYTRILTLYHRNPYTYMAGDFYLDPWLRFTQWTDNYYPYGPIFLLVSIVPSFLGFTKFALTFLLFKTMTVVFYLLGAKMLEKLNKKWAVMFVTNPLIIIEGLVNGHNDLIGLSLVIISIYCLFKKKKLLSLIMIILSIGIKYITLPFLIIFLKLKNARWFTLITIFIGIIFLITKMEIQPWYFILFFALIPFFEDLVTNLNIFFFGLLMSYYPYVRHGGWGKIIGWTSSEKVILKHKIIYIFLLMNIIYLLFRKLVKKKVL